MKGFMPYFIIDPIYKVIQPFNDLSYASLLFIVLHSQGQRVVCNKKSASFYTNEAL